MSDNTFVSIGKVNLDTDSLYKDGTFGKGGHVDYMVYSHYEKDGQIWNMPVSSPSGFQNQSTAFVQLASPTLTWCVEWTGCRTRTVPDIPDPYPSESSNWVLLDDHWDLVSVTTLGDQSTPLYRAEGVFYYGHKNPAAATIQDIAFPKVPWLENSIIRVVQRSDLKKDIIFRQGDSGVPGGTGGRPPNIGGGTTR